MNKFVLLHFLLQLVFLQSFSAENRIINCECHTNHHSVMAKHYQQSSGLNTVVSLLFQDSERLRLFKTAVDKHNEWMSDATNLQGESALASVWLYCVSLWLQRLLCIYCPGYAEVRGNERADGQASIADVTSGLQHGRCFEARGTC